ncbi:N amino acid transport system protein [Termitomyces sp. T112]|nr:N amino acid transport system protein [Termitomyces sp. T112]
MDPKPVTSDKGSPQTTSSPDVSGEERYNNVPPSDITFEEYLHFAAVQRRLEDDSHKVDAPEKKSWMARFSKDVNVNVRDTKELSVIEDSERINAFRAMRTASWASVFYLITTDILGPFNAPFAISQVGWVPGVVLYCFMGLAALYCGLILWRLFIRLDSQKYPLRTYADIAERLLGKSARHVCTVLQTLQLIVNVGTICLSNGQALSQMSKNRLCFSVCIVVWALAGMIVGQIRTLKSYGWLANSAVWINLLIIFISMGVAAHSPPNFEAASRAFGTPQGPVQTHAFEPLALNDKVNGIMNMVFAYGGAMIFPEMMAEMRRPMDFWKGMVLAQALIFSAYLLYGAFIYGFQGQFTIGLAYQGLSIFAWQTVCNALSLVTGLIAAGLYGNIGIKIIYINIVEGWFNGPRLLSRTGRLVWTPMVVVYWALAFVIGSAIPQVQTISALIAAIAIMQFSYSFPLLLRVAYDVKTDAMVADKTYVPGQGNSGRIDTWRHWSRWRRGMFSGRWYFKLFNFLTGLAALAMAFLGMWGAGKTIQTTFAHAGAATSFGCSPPV